MFIEIPCLLLNIYSLIFIPVPLPAHSAVVLQSNRIEKIFQSPTFCFTLTLKLEKFPSNPLLVTLSKTSGHGGGGGGVFCVTTFVVGFKICNAFSK